MAGTPSYSRAAAYYRNHSDADTIRKIQNFLSGRGYYEGNLDGNFGQDTYDAVRKYQQKYGLDADGMWGEATNSVHRLLNATNAPYRNDASGTSGAHLKQMTGVNTGNKNAMTNQQKLAYINNTITPEFYQDQSSLWGDSDEAAKRRELLRSYGADGERMLMDFYNDTDANYRNSINTRYLPAQALAAKRKEFEDNAIQNVTNAISNFHYQAADVASEAAKDAATLAFFTGTKALATPFGWPLIYGPGTKSPAELTAEVRKRRRGISNKNGGRLYQTYFRG